LSLQSTSFLHLRAAPENRVPVALPGVGQNKMPKWANSKYRNHLRRWSPGFRTCEWSSLPWKAKRAIPTILFSELEGLAKLVAIRPASVSA
jgi:hypothetical protein